MLFQVPAKPNYSLVLYFASDRPINVNSLLGKFVDGTDMFRDSRFKLIPSIVEVLQSFTVSIKIMFVLPAFVYLYGFYGIEQQIYNFLNRDIGW